jgi:CDP-glucose 4,6-dehydratase
LEEQQGSVESLVMFGDAFRNKNVWLSGHTGFKGAWLAQWLTQLGAKVHGFAQAPNTKPALFDQLSLERQIRHAVGDIRDLPAVCESIRAARPDFVFHLAAQSLVRLSYAQPVETYQTNALGTAHVLEALRGVDWPCVAVCITSDKCYENREWLHGYRETDPLGGHDPYSASKAAAEIVIGSYRRSFFARGPVKVASARAGNVIGGGDWAADRIVPDCARALKEGRPIPVRNKTAVRPWQHVLEPLSGYLWLAAILAQPQLGKHDLSKVDLAFNFGPNASSGRTVAELVQEILRHWPGSWKDLSDPNAPHEAGTLRLAIDKAHALLEWVPVWDFAPTIEKTVSWYRATQDQKALDLTARQIDEYVKDARAAGLRWAANG